MVVSTTEHTHAFATLPALQLGKHVYCEKPLTHNVWEARVIREAAAKAEGRDPDGHPDPRRRQLPARRRADPDRGDRPGDRGPRLGRPGLGPAVGRGRREATATSSRSRERPTESSPIPEGLDWDLWLGPAPARPFHEVYFPGPKWYRWWDFGNGTMSDLGSHWIDLPFWALKLQRPEDHRGVRPAAPPGDRPGVDARHLRIRTPRRQPPVRLLVPGGRQATSVT